MTVSTALHQYLCGGEFRLQLVKDYKRFEILAEGGLRTAVHRLLRRKLRALGGAEQYRVTCETRLGSFIPDIVVWKNKQPRFLIECKDTVRFSVETAEKDWKKLKSVCPQYPTVKRGYLIYVARKRDNVFPLKVSTGKCRITLVKAILSDYLGKAFGQWETTYLELLHYRVPKLATKAASAH